MTAPIEIKPIETITTRLQPLRKSYKPSTNELILHEEIQELKHTLFKGVPAKITRLNKEFIAGIEQMFVVQESVVYTREDREKSAEYLMRLMLDTHADQLQIGKKKFLKTGVRLSSGTQILLTLFNLPVPHIKHLSIILVTLDFSSPKIKKHVTKSRYISLNISDDLPPEEKAYYENYYCERTKTTETLTELMTRILFDIVPPRKVA